MTQPSDLFPRIFLSPPHLSGSEADFVAEALATNWVAPGGPHVAAFEREFAARIGIRHAVAVSSGTAALHLALRVLNLQPGDEVYCPTLTFIASVGPVIYERATPVLIDSAHATWNLDPELLAEELQRSSCRGRLPRAIIAVDLYGQCADYEPIRQLCAQYQVPLIEDAAEALGATYHNQAAGTFGWANIFSFNGNKIITTSGGGMLATNDDRLAAAALKLSQQAREPVPHYEHREVGYNYRLSNVLAGIGRAQLAVLDQRVTEKQRNFAYYQSVLGDQPGLALMPEADYGKSNRWLTCLQVEPELFGATCAEIRQQLETHNIESRPVWKPMHLQPVFANCRIIGGRVAEEIFARGLCLPSGTNLSQSDLARITEAILSPPRKSFSS